MAANLVPTPCPAVLRAPDEGAGRGGRSLAPGDPAPAFSLPTDGGGTLALADLIGKRVVLYFYPRDNTPGCTTEARDFRDRVDHFAGLGAVILGVSRDSVKSHDNFKAKQDLPFTLVSDPENQACQAYGVWVEKTMYGKTSMGVERSTFLIDETGVIRRVWRKVKVAGHADAVLEALRDLT